MAADYTDGGGWAKLDQAAAFGLARAASSFPTSKLEKYTRMLLVLYSGTGRDGCVTMGRRTLAERAGVSEDTARSFIDRLEDRGVLIPAGEKVTQNGTYTLRRWEWLVGEGGGLKPPGGGCTPKRLPGETRTKIPGGGCTPNNLPAKTNTQTPHNRCQKQMLGAGGSAAAAPPPENIQMFGPNVPGLGMRTD